MLEHLVFFAFVGGITKEVLNRRLATKIYDRKSWMKSLWMKIFIAFFTSISIEWKILRLFPCRERKREIRSFTSRDSHSHISRNYNKDIFLLFRNDTKHFLAASTLAEALMTLFILLSVKYLFSLARRAHYELLRCEFYGDLIVIYLAGIVLTSRGNRFWWDLLNAKESNADVRCSFVEGINILKPFK